MFLFHICHPSYLCSFAIQSMSYWLLELSKNSFVSPNTLKSQLSNCHELSRISQIVKLDLPLFISLFLFIFIEMKQGLVGATGRFLLSHGYCITKHNIQYFNHEHRAMFYTSSKLPIGNSTRNMYACQSNQIHGYVFFCYQVKA